jgi:hypothetical protein
MGSANSKIECLIKPGQSGKTRTMQQRIKEYEEWSELWGDGKSAISIVICSNNKKLVDQTTARMNTDLFESASTVSNESDTDSDDKIVGTCFSWSSGTKKTNVSTDALAWKILNNEIGMIVCCAHKTRLAYLFKLLSDLNRSSLFDRKINVFIDEADESIKLWSNPAVDVTNLTKVTSVMLVSATFNSVVKKYGRIRIVPLVETYNPETYSKVSDCKILEDETVGTACDYLKGVFAKHEETLMKPGVRLFAPGNIQKVSHYDVAEFLRSKGYAVMILNGDRKCIVKPDGSEISIADHMDEDKPEEIGKVMTRIYYDNGLDKGLFAITGQLCLGRGLTFQNERFLFDFGIIPTITDPANAYQCACRMAGNIKKVVGYRQATLVTTMKMRQTILQQENVAATLARRIHEGEIPADVGEEEFGIAKPVRERDYELSVTFESFSEAKIWASNFLSYGVSQFKVYTDENNERYIKYRGKPRMIMTELDARAAFDLGQGANTQGRILPVSDLAWGVADTARAMPVGIGGDNSALKYIVIYKKDKLKA